MQSGNKDGFLSMDFGLKEFGLKDESERLRLYREFVYGKSGLKAGSLERRLSRSVTT